MKKRNLFVLGLISLFLVTGCDSNIKNNDIDNSESNSSELTTSNDTSKYIKRIQCGADEVGIYALIIVFTDQVADKGSIEYLYYGAESSPQKDSIVQTFRADYYKEESGTFDIVSYINGDINQHYTHRTELKIDNTFSALIRASLAIISYTPNGGVKQEITTVYAKDYMKH